MADYDLKGSEARLWALVEERTKAGADTTRIDQRIWDLFGDEWAIMFTDLSGLNGSQRGTVHCPFHDDRTPSLSIDLAKGVFRCHGACGDGVKGDFRKFRSLVAKHGLKPRGGRGGGRPAAKQPKALNPTSAPGLTRSMHIAIKDLRLDRLDVIHAGRDTFALAPKVRAVALADVTSSGRRVIGSSGRLVI